MKVHPYGNWDRKHLINGELTAYAERGVAQWAVDTFRLAFNFIEGRRDLAEFGRAP